MMWRVAASALISAAALAMGSANASEPTPRPFSWTGIYVGLHAGHAWADVDWALDYPFGNPPASSSFNNDGLIAGGQIGIQQQFGNWVLGGEVSISGGFSPNTIKGVNLFGGSTAGTLRTDIDWLLLATARVGYASGPWLGYVKGGYAGAMINLDTDDNVPPDFVSSSGTWHNGWTIGGGVEYAIARGLVFGVEYNYVDLSRNITTNVINEVSGATVGQASSDVDTAIHTIMARLSVKLGQ
jgi:outer membrane immunogenic protein